MKVNLTVLTFYREMTFYSYHEQVNYWKSEQKKNLMAFEKMKCRLSIVFKLYLTRICKNSKLRVTFSLSRNNYFDEGLRRYVKIYFEEVANNLGIWNEY